MYRLFGSVSSGRNTKRSQNINSKDHQCETNQTLCPAIDASGQTDSQQDDDRAESRDGERVAQGIDHAEFHGDAFRRLHADHVGDRGNVIVVEAVAEAEHSCGEQGGVERGMRRQNIFRYQLRAELFSACCGEGLTNPRQLLAEHHIQNARATHAGLHAHHAGVF